MMQQSPDLSSLQDIDLSSYSEHFQEYRKRIESRLARRIRFIDLASDQSRKEKRTHVDSVFCKKHFPAVFVDCEDLEQRPIGSQEALLAHEVTHIELLLVERYPMVGCETEELKPKAERVHRINIMLQDFVIDKRLAAFGFERWEDFEQSVDNEVRQARKAKNLTCGEFQSAVELAGFYLSPWCKSSHQSHLRRVYSERHRNAPERADEIIHIVRSTDKLLQPEGQKSALKQIAAMFDLDSTYTIS